MSVLDKLKGLLKGREEQAPEVDTAAVSEGNTKHAEETAPEGGEGEPEED